MISSPSRRVPHEYPTEEYPPPPAHLSPRAQQLWRELGPIEAKSTQRRCLFLAALEALSRADQARELIAKEGLVVKSERSEIPHINPAVRIEREARAQFSDIWSNKLHLTFDHER